MQFHTPFLFFCCQHGAENAIKSSLCAPNGPFRLSFSQPGFVTLKGTMSISPWSRALPISPWIRCSGHAFSSVAGDDAIPLVARVVEEHRSLDWEFLHIWERDPALPGWNGFEPGSTPLVESLADEFQKQLKALGDPRHASVGSIAPPNAKVLDIVLIEPNRWWIGSHFAENKEQRWPGGVFPVSPPPNMLSRAYLKLAEAIAWSELPMKKGDAVVEIGSSPEELASSC